MEVNHQWSKSQEFEDRLRSYVAAFISHDIEYLNVVRPLSELHIAKLFTSHSAYFAAATSCNRNWVLTERTPDAPRWCNTCPKCAFSFALFAAFLPSTTVEQIFGHNLFEDHALLPLYRELWGSEGFKPFECVGTPEETQAALYLAHDKPGYASTPIVEAFVSHVLPTLKDPKALVDELLAPEPGLVSATTTKILKQAGIL